VHGIEERILPGTATVINPGAGSTRRLTNRCYERGHAPGRRVVVIEIGIAIEIEIGANQRVLRPRTDPDFDPDPDFDFDLERLRSCCAAKT
jgi:hypothetical protein